MTTRNFTQVAFRLRNDDGSETTATWRQAQGVNDSVPEGVNFRVRFLVDETTTAGWSAFTWNLRYSLNAAAYAAVTASTPVQFSLSPNFADGANTTTQLTGGSGTFVTANAAMKEATGGATNTGTAGQYFDIEFCLKLDPAQLAHNDTIALRIYNGTTALATYTQTPTVTVVAVASITSSNTLAAVTQAASAVSPIVLTAANTLAAVTQSATAKADAKLSAADTLAAVTQSASATVTAASASITSAATLGPVTQSAAVAADARLASALTLAAVTQAASAQAPAQLTATATLAAIAQTATVKADARLASAATLAAVTQSAAATVTGEAGRVLSMNAVLGAVTQGAVLTLGPAPVIVDSGHGEHLGSWKIWLRANETQLPPVVTEGQDEADLLLMLALIDAP